MAKKVTKVETPIDQRETFVSLQKSFAESGLSVEEKLQILIEWYNLKVYFQYSATMKKHLDLLNRTILQRRSKSGERRHIWIAEG